MNGPKLFLSVILGFFILLPVNTTPTFSRSKELTLALPPYNISETSSGMEFDIVKEALEMKGYTIKPKYVPQARRNRELLNREVDGALTINPDSGVKAFYSDEHIVYQNVVVSFIWPRPLTKGSRKNNFTFSHPIFRSSWAAPQSQNPRKSVAIPVVSLNRRSQI